jgi:betaine-homocysteine S-methyltransferase
MTFYASDDKLATVGLAGKVDDINRAAVQIARQVAAEGDAMVAGNLSLTWAYEPDDATSADHVRALFDRQIETQLAAGGVDFFIGETFGYLGEALLFVERAKRTGLPVMVTMSFENSPALAYEGAGPAECARRLEAAGADIVGVNCLSGPAQQLPVAIEMRSAVDCFVAAQPAAYRTTDERPDFTALPEFPRALDPLQLPRADLGRFAADARDAGISYIGSCCGSVQAHVRAMAQVLGKVTAEEREWRTAGKPMSAYEQHHHDEANA